MLPGLGPDFDEYGGEFLASVLPCELYTTRGKGAPLDIRIALEAIFDGIGRGRYGGLIPAVPWGHLLGRIYPGRKVAQVAGTVWPGLRHALDQLEKGPQWSLPIANGRGGWEGWRVVTPNPRPLDRPPLRTGRLHRHTSRYREPEARKPARPARDRGSGGAVHPGACAHKRAARRVGPARRPAGEGGRGLKDEARALLDWLAERGYATWTSEPGWRPEQRPLIGPPK